MVHDHPEGQRDRELMNPANNSVTDGWVLIAAYTRAQAIADGVLVDVSRLARETGFKWPVAMTAEAWGECVAWDNANQALQDETGRLWDVLVMAALAARVGSGGTRKVFQVLRVPNRVRAQRAQLVALVLRSGPGDEGEPVMTITLPGQD